MTTDFSMRKLDETWARMKAGLGILNSLMVLDVGLKEIPIIARLMGYRSMRLLERVELFDMVEYSDTSGIAQSDLDSFIRADAVAETTDEEGRTRCLAVEISFTSHKRDVDRAIRNAEFIARFTGVPASAAAASFQMSDEIQDDVDAGNIFWHELVNDFFSPNETTTGV